LKQKQELDSLYEEKLKLSLENLKRGGSAEDLTKLQASVTKEAEARNEKILKSLKEKETE